MAREAVQMEGAHVLVRFRAVDDVGDADGRHAHDSEADSELAIVYRRLSTQTTPGGELRCPAEMAKGQICRRCGGCEITPATLPKSDGCSSAPATSSKQ